MKKIGIYIYMVNIPISGVLQGQVLLSPSRTYVSKISCFLLLTDAKEQVNQGQEIRETSYLLLIIQKSKPMLKAVLPLHLVYYRHLYSGGVHRILAKLREAGLLTNIGYF